MFSALQGAAFGELWTELPSVARLRLVQPGSHRRHLFRDDPSPYSAEKARRMAHCETVFASPAAFWSSLRPCGHCTKRTDHHRLHAANGFPSEAIVPRGSLSWSAFQETA